MLGKNRQQQQTNYNSNGQQRKSYGLWVNMSKNGKEYLTFEIDGIKYIAFENTNKTSDRSPDYNIYKKDDLQSAQQNNSYGYQGQNNGYQQNNEYVNNDYSGLKQVQPQNVSQQNPNVGAKQPRNPTYNPDVLDDLTL